MIFKILIPTKDFVMFKDLILGLSMVAFMSACSEPSSSSDSSITSAISSEQPQTPTEVTSSTDSSVSNTDIETTIANETTVNTEVTTTSQTACVNGSYDFRTDSDGRFHFHSTFDGDGNVIYHIDGSPKGTYTVSNSSIAFVGPFGPNFSDATLTWRTNGCIATELRGESLGGEASLTATLR